MWCACDLSSNEIRIDDDQVALEEIEPVYILQGGREESKVQG